MSSKKKKKTKKRKNKHHQLLGKDLEFYGAWINSDWQSTGSAFILFARKLPSGFLIFAHFAIITSANKCEDCFLVNCITEERFRKDYIEGRKLLKVDIVVIEDLLKGSIRCNKEDAKEVPDDFYGGVKLVGKINWEEEKEEEVSSNLLLKYNMLIDQDDVEAEIRQVPNFEESDNSTDGAREFIWQENSKKKLFGKIISKKCGYLRFQEEKLILEVIDVEQKKELDLKILQYLGAAIENIA